MADLGTLIGWPVSRAGKWALYAIFGFFTFLIIFFGFIQMGERGGSTFFENPYLAVPILLSAACGVVSAFLSFWALVISKDRRLVLLMSLTVGAFVIWFVIAEIVGHDEPPQNTPTAGSLE